MPRRSPSRDWREADLPAMVMPMSSELCRVCHHQMTTAEATAYGSSCEDCWTGANERSFWQSAAAKYSPSAVKYSPAFIGELDRITNQQPKPIQGPGSEGEQE